ncbi:MAG: electron transport complex protein RnfA [Eubacteriaceae bacterium]|nr:electron transport complex protein RnfA [Eubacteriaceae bacterium]
MKEMLMILFSVILIDNYVLSQFLGICPFLGVSKKLDSAVGMSVAVTFVMVLSTLATWPIQTFLLTPNGIGYMQTVVFILVIASLVQLVEIILKKYIPGLHKSLGVYLPLITTNCAVLGVCISNIDDGYNFGQSIVSSFGAGIGFLVAMVLFAGIRQKIEHNDIPKSFQGIPSTLVAASILAMSFMGFSGMVDGIFG